MLHKAELLLKEANELKNLCMEQMLDTEVLFGMDEETFALYRKTYNMMDLSMELVMEQCKLFDEMDKKLNKILEKMES